MSLTFSVKNKKKLLGGYAKALSEREISEVIEGFCFLDKFSLFLYSLAKICSVCTTFLAKGEKDEKISIYTYKSTIQRYRQRLQRIKVS